MSQKRASMSHINMEVADTTFLVRKKTLVRSSDLTQGADPETSTRRASNMRRSSSMNINKMIQDAKGQPVDGWNEIDVMLAKGTK
jgi:hypothetical protein